MATRPSLGMRKKERKNAKTKGKKERKKETAKTH
jgi:hypothetical protein